VLSFKGFFIAGAILNLKPQTKRLKKLETKKTGHSMNDPFFIGMNVNYFWNNLLI